MLLFLHNLFEHFMKVLEFRHVATSFFALFILTLAQLLIRRANFAFWKCPEFCHATLPTASSSMCLFEFWKIASISHYSCGEQIRDRIRKGKPRYSRSFGRTSMTSRS